MEHSKTISEQIGVILEKHGTRLFYRSPRQTDPVTGLVPLHVIARVAVDVAPLEADAYRQVGIDRCAVHVGLSGMGPRYMKVGESNESALAQVDPQEEFTPLTLHGKSHALDVLGLLRAIASRAVRWRGYYDQVAAVLDSVHHEVQGL